MLPSRHMKSASFWTAAHAVSQGTHTPESAVYPLPHTRALICSRLAIIAVIDRRDRIPSDSWGIVKNKTCDLPMTERTLFCCATPEPQAAMFRMEFVPVRFQRHFISSLLYGIFLVTFLLCRLFCSSIRLHNLLSWSSFNGNYFCGTYNKTAPSCHFHKTVNVSIWFYSGIISHREWLHVLQEPRWLWGFWYSLSTQGPLHQRPCLPSLFSPSLVSILHLRRLHLLFQ